MSLDCRYFTNGEKAAFTVLHTDTGMVEEFQLNLTGKKFARLHVTAASIEDEEDG